MQFKGTILNIIEAKTTIGRLGTTHCLKGDDSISRRHCTFLLSNNELKVVDEGSKYGTTVNNEHNKVTKTPLVLKSGDKIHFGCFENIWEIHHKPDVVESSRKKAKPLEEMPSNVSSLFSSNTSNKSSSTKSKKKFEVVIDSSDEDQPKPSKQSRLRKNVIKDSEEVVPSSSKVNKQPTQRESESIRSQMFFDSDEEKFATSTQNPKSSEEFASAKSLGKHLTIDSDDEICVNVPKKTANTRKRPPCEPIETESAKKAPRLGRNLRSQPAVPKAAEIEENQDTPLPKSSVSKKPEPEKSSKKAETEKSSNKREVENSFTNSIFKKPEPSSTNSRKRESTEDLFSFETNRKRAIKRSKTTDESTIDSTDSSTASSTSMSLPKQRISFKTSNICNPEVYASVEYDIDDSSGWLSSKVANIKVKDEQDADEDETDNTSARVTVSFVANIVRKPINLNASLDSSKIFKKQKYQEPTESISFRKLNVQDVKQLYAKEDDINWD